MNIAKTTSLLGAACLLLGTLALPATAGGGIGDSPRKGDSQVLDDKAPRDKDDTSGDIGNQPCNQDVTADGKVDIDDLLQVLLHWGPCRRVETRVNDGFGEDGFGDTPPASGNGTCETDIDKNGATDLDDLIQILLNMGRTCQDLGDTP